MKIFSFKVATVKLKTFMYIAAVSISLYSCSSDDSSADDNNCNGYYFKAIVKDKEMKCHLAKFEGGGEDNRWEHIAVGGSVIRDNGLFLNFKICKKGGNIKPGIYSTPLEPEMVARFGITFPEGIYNYDTNNAKDTFTVKIEKINEDGIKGTFYGTVRNKSGQPISIKEGSFNVPHDTLVFP